MNDKQRLCPSTISSGRSAELEKIFGMILWFQSVVHGERTTSKSKNEDSGTETECIRFLGTLDIWGSQSWWHRSIQQLGAADLAPFVSVLPRMTTRCAGFGSICAWCRLRLKHHQHHHAHCNAKQISCQTIGSLPHGAFGHPKKTKLTLVSLELRFPLLL